MTADLDPAKLAQSPSSPDERQRNPGCGRDVEIFFDTTRIDIARLDPLLEN
jgi:hypothetical protein